MSEKRKNDNRLVDLTDIDPGEIMSRRSEFDDELSGNESLVSSGVSTTTTVRRITAAEKLNRDLLFGETTLPEDLDDDWSFVSSKNAEKRTVHATGTLDTLIHLIKGNVGPGLLSLSFAVSSAGYVVSPIGILIIGLLAIHNMGLLLDSAKTLCRWNGIQALDYAETMMFAVKERGGTRRISKMAKVFVNIFLIITQFGFCSVYFVFLGTTLNQVMKVTYCIHWSRKVSIAIFIIPITIFSWIRNLDNLAPLSLIANVGIFFGIFVIICDEIYKLTTSGPDSAAVLQTDSNLVPYGSFIPTCVFLGNAMYSFEGIGVVLPLENKMKKPENAKRVVYGGMSFTLSLFVCFSLLGYLVYGERTQASVPLNLCGTTELTTTIFMLAKLGIGVAVFITYLLMFYVPLDFLEPYVYKIIKLDTFTYKYPRYFNVIQTLVQIVFRTLLVLITATLALAIPDLDDLITLVGAVASSALALVFPPCIEILTFWNDPERKLFGVFPRICWVIKDICIIIIGILSFMFGTFAAIHSIVYNFEGKDKGSSPCGNDLLQCPYYN